MNFIFVYCYKAKGGWSVLNLQNIIELSRIKKNNLTVKRLGFKKVDGIISTEKEVEVVGEVLGIVKRVTYNKKMNIQGEEEVLVNIYNTSIDIKKGDLIEDADYQYKVLYILRNDNIIQVRGVYSV